MNIRVLPSEQDDIVILNYEGIAVGELQFYHFLMTDCVLALSQTK